MKTKEYYSDTQEILDFEIWPKLDKAYVLSDLNPVDNGSYYSVDCPVCGHKKSAYIYKDGVQVCCNRLNHCGAVTTIWDYVKEKDGLSQQATLQKLAEYAGFELPKGSEMTYDRVEKIKRRAQILEVCQSLFRDHLKQHIEALNYLKTRGIEVEDEIDEAELGAFPPIPELKAYLLSRGFSEEVIEESQILSQSNMGRTHILTIPFRDPNKQLKGFIVRAIRPGIEPKYLYTKGEMRNTLFNFKPHSRTRQLVVVEGILDAVIAEIKTNLNNVVATGSNSITESQFENAKRYGVTQFVFGFDNDKAGLEGTEKAVRRAQKYGVQAYVMSPYDLQLWDKENNPDAIKDPDEYIRKKGAASFETLVRTAMGAAAWRARQLLLANKSLGESQHGLDTILSLALEQEAGIIDPIEADQFLQIICHYCGTTLEKLNYRRMELKAKRRNEEAKKDILAAAKKIADLANNGDVRQALEHASNSFAELKAKTVTVERRPYTLADLRTHLQTMKEGLRSGLDMLDRYIRFKPGSLSYVAGRPSHGKTTMLSALCMNMVENYPDLTFPYISIEEISQQVSLKMINALSEEVLDEAMNLYQIANYITGENTGNPKINAGIAKFEEYTRNNRLLIVEDISFIHDIEAYATEQCSKHKVGAIFIDYIQKIRSDGKFGSRQLELQAISARLLDLAKFLKIPFIIGAQMGRNKEQKVKLRLDNLREAGDIENDAAIVLGIWNEAMENAQIREEPVIDRVVPLDIVILKNRDGIVNRTITVDFDRPILKIKNQVRYFE